MLPKHERLEQVDALAVGVEPKFAAKQTLKSQPDRSDPPLRKPSLTDYFPPRWRSISTMALSTLISTLAASRYLSTARLNKRAHVSLVSHWPGQVISLKFGLNLHDLDCHGVFLLGRVPARARVSLDHLTEGSHPKLAADAVWRV